MTLKLGKASFVVLGLVSALAGCGKPQDDSSRYEIPAKSLTEAQRIASQASSSCADLSDCNEAVGFLTTATASRAAMCTSFLISPDILATNNHCIPDDLKRAGSGCGDRIWVHFPATSGRPAERASCRRVLGVSPDGEATDPDFAFLQLDRAMSREPLVASRAGLPDGEAVTVSKMNPASQRYAIGVLESVRCKVAQRALIGPSFTSAFSPVGAFGDCTVVHGNSGSPVLDSDGRFRAVVHATVVEEAARNTIRRQGIPLLFGDTSPMGLATNLACVSLPPGVPADSALAPECSSPPPSGYGSTESRTTEMAKAVDRELVEAVARWSPVLTHFEWERLVPAKGSTLHYSLRYSSPASGSDAIYGVAVPRCFRRPSDWLGDYRNRDAVELEVSLPVWEGKVGLNRYYQLDYRLSRRTGDLSAQLSFDAKQLRKKGRSRVTVTVSDPILSRVTVSDFELTVCPQ